MTQASSSTRSVRAAMNPRVVYASSIARSASPMGGICHRWSMTLTGAEPGLLGLGDDADEVLAEGGGAARVGEVGDVQADVHGNS